jgi:hypothetical protein
MSEMPLPYASSMDRSALYIRLWAIWLAILVVGIVYVILSSVGAF